MSPPAPGSAPIQIPISAERMMRGVFLKRSRHDGMILATFCLMGFMEMS